MILVNESSSIDQQYAYIPSKLTKLQKDELNSTVIKISQIFIHKNLKIRMFKILFERWKSDINFECISLHWNISYFDFSIINLWNFLFENLSFWKLILEYDRLYHINVTLVRKYKKKVMTRGSFDVDTWRSFSPIDQRHSLLDGSIRVTRHWKWKHGATCVWKNDHDHDE